jgi:hypothetical protein
MGVVDCARTAGTAHKKARSVRNRLLIPESFVKNFLLRALYFAYLPSTNLSSQNPLTVSSSIV